MSERLFLRCFAFILICGGALIAIVLPPFQVPDELPHFERAYELSLGHCQPPDHFNWPTGYNQDAATFHGFLDQDQIVTAGMLAATIRARFAPVINAPAVSQSVAPPIHYEDVYPCVLYTPGALAIIAARPFHPSLIALGLIVRLATLLVCGSALIFGLRLMPFGKEAYAAVALLPMTLEQVASASEDAAVFAIGFVGLAFLLRLVFVGSDRPLSRYDRIALPLLSIALAIAKIDALLLAIVFFIPTARFGSGLRRMASVLGCGACAVIAFAASPVFAGTTWHAFVRIAAPLGVDPTRNGAFAGAHPATMLRDLAHTIVQMKFEYFTEIVGTFGWLACRLPAPYVWLGIVLLLVVAVRCDTPHGMTRLRLVLVAIPIVAVVAIFYSLYLVNQSSDAVGNLLLPNATIAYVQGRYFLPFISAGLIACGLLRVGGRRYDRFFVIFASIILATAGIRAIIGMYYLV